jgi:hypothetical protein
MSFETLFQELRNVKVDHRYWELSFLTQQIESNDNEGLIQFTAIWNSRIPSTYDCGIYIGILKSRTDYSIAIFGYDKDGCRNTYYSKLVNDNFKETNF